MDICTWVCTHMRMLICIWFVLYFLFNYQHLYNHLSSVMFFFFTLLSLCVCARLVSLIRKGFGGLDFCRVVLRYYVCLALTCSRIVVAPAIELVVWVFPLPVLMVVSLAEELGECLLRQVQFRYFLDCFIFYAIVYSTFTVLFPPTC